MIIPSGKMGTRRFATFRSCWMLAIHRKIMLKAFACCLLPAACSPPPS
jgi:hypothetical protein